MTDSSVRLLAVMILFPVLVVLAVAVALIGCDAQLSVTHRTRSEAEVSPVYRPDRGGLVTS